MLTFAAVAAFAAGGQWLSAAAVIGVLALLTIRKLLNTGHFGIWLGATFSAFTATVTFAALTLLSPVQHAGSIAVGIGLCLLQLHYFVTLLAPATRRFFTQHRTRFVS